MINFTSRTAFYMRPEFQEMRRNHKISRETLILLMSAAVQTKILI